MPTTVLPLRVMAPCCSTLPGEGTTQVGARTNITTSTMVLNHIYFDFDRATLRQESYSELNKVIEMMQMSHSLKV